MNVFSVKWDELCCMFVIVLRIYSNSLMIVSYCNNVVGWYELGFDYLEVKSYYILLSPLMFILICLFSLRFLFPLRVSFTTLYLNIFLIYFHICVRYVTRHKFCISYLSYFTWTCLLFKIFCPNKFEMWCFRFMIKI